MPKHYSTNRCNRLSAIDVETEGIWDSRVTRVASTVATAIMKLEEADRNGFVPEHRKLRAVKTSFDLHKRQGKLRYLIKTTKSGAAGFAVRQIEFSW